MATAIGAMIISGELTTLNNDVPRATDALDEPMAKLSENAPVVTIMPLIKWLMRR